MIPRLVEKKVQSLLDKFPATGLLGPRQVGKTTLALDIGKGILPSPTYIDLELPSDLAKLQEPELYFQHAPEGLIILDEIQRLPNLYPVLRSVIDQRRRQGKKFGQFLLLGSASLDLLKQSAESLAGRIVYQELGGFTALEITNTSYTAEQLWLRGGFPNSLLANSDEASFQWRAAFIRTYLERDIPQLGPRIPAETLRRFWIMLAHGQGTLLNSSCLAAGMGVSVPTINRYLDLLVDLLLVRALRPWAGNVGKRLVKSPKIYIRDSGIAHALLNIRTFEELLSHPVIGKSYEGFVIENLISKIKEGTSPWFYRTSAGAEIDLLLENSNQERIVIEVKRSLTPTVSIGLHNAFSDVNAIKGYVVYPGKERYKLSKQIEAISLANLLGELQASSF